MRFRMSKEVRNTSLRSLTWKSYRIKNEMQPSTCLKGNYSRIFSIVHQNRYDWLFYSIFYVKIQFVSKPSEIYKSSAYSTYEIATLVNYSTVAFMWNVLVRTVSKYWKLANHSILLMKLYKYRSLTQTGPLCYWKRYTVIILRILISETRKFYTNVIKEIYIYILI